MEYIQIDHNDHIVFHAIFLKRLYFKTVTAFFRMSIFIRTFAVTTKHHIIKYERTLFKVRMQSQPKAFKNIHERRRITN